MKNERIRQRIERKEKENRKFEMRLHGGTSSKELNAMLNREVCKVANLEELKEHIEEILYPHASSSEIELREMPVGPGFDLFFGGSHFGCVFYNFETLSKE